jgi:hypothetical protein
MATADYVLAGNPTITYQPNEGSDTPITALIGAVHHSYQDEHDGKYIVYSAVFTISSAANTGIVNPNIMDMLIDASGLQWGIGNIESDDISGLHTLICERKLLITRYRNS